MKSYHTRQPTSCCMDKIFSSSCSEKLVFQQFLCLVVYFMNKSQTEDLIRNFTKAWLILIQTSCSNRNLQTITVYSRWRANYYPDSFQVRKMHLVQNCVSCSVWRNNGINNITLGRRDLGIYLARPPAIASPTWIAAFAIHPDSVTAYSNSLTSTA